METTDEEDSLDEPTQPFSHTQIGEMLNAEARAPVQQEYPVDLSYFFGFGDAGTPSGMIGSHVATAAAGVCGTPSPTRPQPPRVAPRPVSGPTPAVDDLYPWGPAPAELSAGAAAPEPPVPWTLPNMVPAPEPPVPWTLPAIVAAAPPAGTDVLEDDLRGAGLRSRAGLFVVAAALLACGLAALVWWQTRPEPAPPPEPEPPKHIAMVVTNYDENHPDDSETEALDDTQTDPESKPPTGKVEIDGPTRVTGVRPSDTPHCETKRDRTAQAFADGAWPLVEELTRELKCWRHMNEAKKLRMNALFELERLDECLEVANGTNNRKLKKKWIHLCSHGRG